MRPVLMSLTSSTMSMIARAFGCKAMMSMAERDMQWDERRNDCAWLTGLSSEVWSAVDEVVVLTESRAAVVF